MRHTLVVRTPPPADVIRAFGRRPEQLAPLSGGQGQSWRVDDLVLKPIEDADEAEWTADLLSRLPEVGFRSPRPVAATSFSSWTVDGWAAWSWLAGVHQKQGRWKDILDVGQAFHVALADVDRPEFLDRRTNPWAAGDLAAWGEAPRTCRHEDLATLVERFAATLRPLELRSQLIHGDLGGNVLFAPGLAPAVIDFTPYWRPAGFALAVVIVDAVAWEGAPVSIVDHVQHVKQLDQLIARAAIYRLVTADRTARNRDDIEANVRAHAPLAGLCAQLRGETGPGLRR